MMRNYNCSKYLNAILFLFPIFLPEIGYSQNVYLDAFAKEWNLQNIDLLYALNMVASDLSSTSSPSAVIYEGWDERVMMKPDQDNRMTLAYNEKLTRFSINTKNKKRLDVFNEITFKHGSVIWKFDKDADFLHVMEKHLFTDKRWPLNNGLGDYSQKELTFQQAKELLAKKFNLMMNENEIFLGYQGNQNTIVWHPAQQHEATVRALISAMIKYAFQPQFFYFIRLNPNHNPQTGHDGLKERKELHWVVNLQMIMSESEVKKRNELFR